MRYKKTVYLFYFEDLNLFTNDKGQVICDIYRVLTPQDLFLFRTDNSYNSFPTTYNPEILCEIIPVPDEVCGLPEFPKVDLAHIYS